MIKLTKLLVLSSLIFLIAGLFYASNSFAQEEVTPTPKRLNNGIIKERIQHAREKNIEIKENIKARASEAASRRKERLSEARLKVCRARAQNIVKRLKNITQRAVNIDTKNEQVYMRVDEFYTEKLVPNGHTLSNYADLKAEIEANKANVKTLFESVQAGGKDFDCNSDPKGQVDAFKEDVKALIEANKAYKDSIHIFVKAVRDLAKTVTLKPSPTPTGGAAQ